MEKSYYDRLRLNDEIYINDVKGVVLAISGTNFYYIECGKYTDWYSEDFLLEHLERATPWEEDLHLQKL